MVTPTPAPQSHHGGDSLGRSWRLSNIRALASVLGVTFLLIAAPAATVLIAGVVAALVAALLLQRASLHSAIRRLNAEARELRTELKDSRLLTKQLSARLNESPNYVCLLNESRFTIDPVIRTYAIDQHKIIRNQGGSNMEFLLGHFTCDRFPRDAETSREYYSVNPVVWSDLEVYAYDSEGDLDVALNHDFNNRKEYEIRLEHNNVPRPVPPGGILDLHYGYRVPFHLWGTYYDKPIDRPTHRLLVHIVHPRDSHLRVGISKLSPSSQRSALSENGSKAMHSFELQHPELGTAYQFTWDYDGVEPTDVTMAPPSEAMSAQQL